MVPYRIAKLMIEAKYAGVWFRLDGDRLILTGTPANLDPGILAGLRANKPAVNAALATVPLECHAPTAHLIAGCCSSCTCDHIARHNERPAA